MWCRNCNIETNEKNCPICGHVTEEDIPIEVMWCPKCRTPIVRSVIDNAKNDCPLCYGKVSHMSTRPKIRINTLTHTLGISLKRTKIGYTT